MAERVNTPANPTVLHGLEFQQIQWNSVDFKMVCLFRLLTAAGLPLPPGGSNGGAPEALRRLTAAVPAGCGIDSQGWAGQTALMVASTAGNLPAVQHL